MIDDLPSISNACYAHSVYSGGDFLSLNQNFTALGVSPTSTAIADALQTRGELATRRVQQGGFVPQSTPVLEKIKQEMQMSKRVVQVYIIDPSDQVPLADSMVYADAASHLTDLTDQELFFDIDIKGCLEAHNAKRVGFQNKKVKDRVEMLEPVKVGGLCMTVVEIAVFDKK